MITRAELTDEYHQLVKELLTNLHDVKTVETMADVRKLWRNAYEHQIVARCLNLNTFEGFERPQAEEAARDIRNFGESIQRNAEKLVLWSHVPLAKSRREKYLKALKLNYCSIVKAGAVLVRIDNPHLVENYAAHASFAA